MKNLKSVLRYQNFSILNSGQSLVEVLVAIALASIILPALLTGIVASREGKSQTKQRLEAAALLREAEEATRSIREKGWSNLTNGTFHPTIQGAEYIASICGFLVNNCSIKYDQYQGFSDSLGQLHPTFTYSPQAIVEVWATKPSSSGCSGLGCFAPSNISSLTINGLAPNTEFIVSICDFTSNSCSSTFASFQGFTNGSGQLAANFPSYSPQAIVEVWITKPASSGCTGSGCLGAGTITNMTISGLQAGSSWSLLPGSENINGFTRKLTISDVFRDSVGNIVASGGTLDPSTKKIQSLVSWSTPNPSQIESAIFLSRHLNNTTWEQTTVSDFNSGTHNGTTTVDLGGPTGGAVELASSPVSTPEFGNKFIVDSISTVWPMYSPIFATDLRFTAQNSKTVNALRVYIHNEIGNSPTYRYGLKNDNGSGRPVSSYLASGTLKATTNGWQRIPLNSNVNLTAGSVYHIFIEHATGTIDTSNMIEIRATQPLNNLYPFDNSPDTSANSALFVKFFNSYLLQNKQPIYTLEFTDGSLEGNPFESGDEFETFGTIVHGEQFQVTSPKTVLDINWLVRKKSSQNPEGPLIVTLENVTTGSILDSGNIVTSGVVTQTYSYYKRTFANPIQLLPGNTYRVFVSAPNVSNARAYMVKRLNNATAQDLNSINFDGTNSVYHVTGFGAINFWDAGGWFFTTQTGGSNSGEFTSQTFNAGSQVAFNNIIWSETLPAGTNIQLQVSVDGNPFVGVNGPGTFFDEPGAIPLISTVGQTIQFKAALTGNGTSTPTLQDVSINYSP